MIMIDKYFDRLFESKTTKMCKLVQSIFLSQLLTVILFSVNLVDSEEWALEDVCKEENSGKHLSCQNFTNTNEIITLYASKENDKTVRVFIYGSNIVSIPQNLLRYTPNATGFYARNNHIDYIDENSFRDGNKLTYIELDNNHLERIHSNVFSGTERLLMCKIIDNQLEKIDLGAFRNLSNVQVFEIFTPCADLMREEYFQYMTALQRLMLKSNMSEIFDAGVLVNNQNLTELVLTENGIKSIAYQSFESLTKLEILDLSHNQLGPIFNVSMIGKIDTLKTLILRGNNLKKLNYVMLRDLFPKLKVLDLSYNNFQRYYGLRMSNYFLTNWTSLHADCGAYLK